MNNLLVNSPTGRQEIIEVSDGGGYFDATRVIWEERIDGPMPVITLGGMTRIDGVLTYSQARADEHIAASKPPVPAQVTMRQARLALLSAGKLATVNAAIAAMTGAQGDAARIEWEFSSEVTRTQPLVLAMGQVLGLTDAQLDALFIAAAAL